MNLSKSNSSNRPAVFLDRDGVLNYKMPEPEYICSWEQFQFIPGAIEAALQLQQAGFLLFIVTNQRGVARSRISSEDLQEIHSRMLRILANHGVKIAKVYICPHEGGCECRKPKPGMLLRAAAEFGVLLPQSWMIGDSISDVHAGRRAGCKTMLIRNGNSGAEKVIGPYLVASNLQHAAEQILAISSP